MHQRVNVLTCNGPFPIAQLIPHGPPEELQPVLDAYGIAHEMRRCANPLLVVTGDWKVLTDVPLFPYMTVTVTVLCRHPSSIHLADR